MTNYYVKLGTQPYGAIAVTSPVESGDHIWLPKSMPPGERSRAYFKQPKNPRHFFEVIVTRVGEGFILVSYYP